MTSGTGWCPAAMLSPTGACPSCVTFMCVDAGDCLGEQPINLACRQYSKEYVKDEQAAHDAHRGIWAGSFEVPADWRRNHKGKHEVRLFPAALSLSKVAVGSH